jgi:hypothetical protein
VAKQRSDEIRTRVIEGSESEPEPNPRVPDPELDPGGGEHAGHDHLPHFACPGTAPVPGQFVFYRMQQQSVADPAKVEDGAWPAVIHAVISEQTPEGAKYPNLGLTVFSSNGTMPIRSVVYGSKAGRWDFRKPSSPEPTKVDGQS